jgi:hypothetical protein
MFSVSTIALSLPLLQKDKGRMTTFMMIEEEANQPPPWRTLPAISSTAA